MESKTDRDEGRERVMEAPFVLFQTPKRERKTNEDVASPKSWPSGRCSGSFVIRMVVVTIMLALFVALVGPLRQQFLLGQISSSLPRSNVSSAAIRWNEPVSTELSWKETPSLRNASASVNNNILSETAWLGMLQRFRLAMETQSYQVWLPIIIRGNKLAEQHLKKVEMKGMRRFALFTSMTHAAINYEEKYNLSFPLLDTSWRNRSIPLLMALGDQRRCEATTFPRFGWCTLEDTKCTMFALPSYNVYRDAPEKSPDYASFHAKLESLYPWSKKKVQAVWRGSATGRISTDWSDLPRAQMVNFSIHYPNLLDAAFVHAKQFNNMYPEQAAQLSNHSRFSNWIKFKDFQKYRAVMDIDGNSWSDRFGNLLCLNSAVIKVQPSNANYFFRELVPWVHYIPVAGNLSDLSSALSFAMSNQTVRDVRAIIFTANEWCRTRLTRESMAKDILRILNSYLQLLGNDERRWRQWDELFEDYQRNMSLVELPNARVQFRSTRVPRRSSANGTSVA